MNASPVDKARGSVCLPFADEKPKVILLNVDGEKTDSAGGAAERVGRGSCVNGERVFLLEVGSPWEAEAFAFPFCEGAGGSGGVELVFGFEEFFHDFAPRNPKWNERVPMVGAVGGRRGFVVGNPPKIREDSF